MISEVIDLLILVEVDIVKLSSDPVLLGSVYVPFEFSLSLLPMPSLESVIDTIPELGLEGNRVAGCGEWVRIDVLRMNRVVLSLDVLSEVL